ncbi:hypothetical protein GCM10008986_09750 [Salinibacillus aidingensis]|uniref:Uncharacterized protein n=2 Tax=Salinibacillus aidingensis TaxID=237684 RepID=A0ABN1AY98_9BACI
MVDTEVTDKIKVFISSQCGIPKYDEVREKLKQLIEETGLANVYLFEKNRQGSTLSAEQEYLYEIDDSDVCIFLIDNKDDVTQAVVNEINRAKAKSKKSIYLFCNEKEKTPTQIQNELMGAKGYRFYVVENFTDFVATGYDSLINDIVKIYKLYTKNRLIDPEFDDYEDVKIEAGFQADESMNKSILKGLDKSKNFIVNQMSNFKSDIKKTNELDDYSEDFLHLVFGKRSIREFNTSLLFDYLENQQSSNLHKVVKLRWKSIQSYWQDDLSSCLKHLKDALNKAKEYSLPKWLIQDILIDLRNVQGSYGEERNQYSLQNDAQKEIDGMSEPLFYPILDRFTNSLYQELDKQRIKERTQSPYSVTFGNHIDIFAELVASIFAIAIYNGSLTHILITVDRLESIAFYLSEKYEEWQFRVLLLKMAIYRGNKKQINSYINTFNDVFGKMNSNDALDIYEFSKTKPIKHQRMISTLEAFKHLGYFFSDYDYANIQREILNMVNDWIEEENRVFVNGNHIFEALKANHLRMDNNKVAETCINAITKKVYRFYDDIFDLLASMGLKYVSDQNSKQIILLVNDIIKDEDKRDKVHKLLDAVITISRTKPELCDDLHQNVMKYLPDHSKKVYQIETMTDSSGYDEKHILDYIEEIKERNNTQGQNGLYAGFGSDPYKTILNIINHNKLEIAGDLANLIIETALETLLNKKQLISDKISAIQLIVFIAKYKNDIAIKDNLYKRIVNNREVVKNVKNDFIDRYTATTLEFNYLLLEVLCGVVDFRAMFYVISRYTELDDFEKIEALKAVNNLMNDEYAEKIDKDILFMTLQFVLSMSNDKNHDVRFFATKALLQMITINTEKTILTQLSKIMDFDSGYIKNTIINDFDQLIVINPKITKLMMQKASVDNNYVIREKGKEYLQKYQLED